MNHTLHISNFRESRRAAAALYERLSALIAAADFSDCSIVVHFAILNSCGILFKKVLTGIKFC